MGTFVPLIFYWAEVAQLVERSVDLDREVEGSNPSRRSSSSVVP